MIKARVDCSSPEEEHSVIKHYKEMYDNVRIRKSSKKDGSFKRLYIEAEVKRQ